MRKQFKLKNPWQTIYNVVIILAIICMGWQIYWLNKEQTFKQLQIDLLTARVNNLKECHLHNDTQCPEGKYSDSEEILEKLKQHANSRF